MMMSGGNVQLKDSDIKATNRAKLSAVKTWSRLKDRETQTATVDNVLYIDHTNLHVDGWLATASGTTNIVNDSEITGGMLRFGALHSYDDANNRKVFNVTAR